MYKKTTLPNGLRIITAPQENSQTVTVIILVGTGAKYEPKDINGISHFLEHMFFTGTAKRPNKKLLVEEMDRLGGVYNAFTGYDFTGYWAKAKKDHFDAVLDWTSDIFLNSTLPQDQIEKERKVINEELNLFLDDPDRHLMDIWTELLYGDQPSGREIIGTRESLKNLDRQKMVAYRENNYSPGNTVVCVAGGLDESAEEQVKKYFSGLIGRESPAKEKVVEKQSRPEVKLFEKQTDQAHLALGVRGYSLSHPQYYALQILSNILGGMMSSRIFLEVRDRLGLAYDIGVSAESDPDAGFLVTVGGFDNQRVEEAIKAILGEYKKISQEKVPADELAKSKDNIKGRISLRLESSDRWASFYADQELLENEILTPEDIFAKIDAVSAEDIQAVAQDIFRPEKLNLAIIGPFKDKERFEKLLDI